MKLPLDPAQRRLLIASPGAEIKRGLDLALALLLAPFLLPVCLLLIILARYSTGQSGLFRQSRVGLYGEPFTLYKIRSMRPVSGVSTHVTTASDVRITRFGRFLRKTKLDELPQLYNVLRGDMSFVGPRPDMAESFEPLGSWAEPVLCLVPGITGPASLAFRNEEELLRQQADPEAYNRDVIFPEKIRINLEYGRTHSVWLDLKIMLDTALKR